MMKFLLWSILISVCLFGCVDKPTVIEGHLDGEVMSGGFKNAPLKKVGVYTIVNGKAELLKACEIDEQGHWSFLLDSITEGFYMVGDDYANQYPLYLKPGDRAGICIDNLTAIPEGKNTPENQALFQWIALSNTIRQKSLAFGKIDSDYRDFFPDLEKFVREADAYKAKLKTRNPQFDALMRRYVDLEKDYRAILFLNTPRSIHPQREERPGYYASIVNESKFRDDTAMLLPNGFLVTDSYFGFAKAEGRAKGLEEIQPFYNALPLYIFNKRLRGEYLLEHVKKYGTYKRYCEVKRDRLGDFSEEQLQRLEALGKEYIKTEPGQPAIDFTYPDTEGKNVSFSDFRGKVVVVDMWATWCGPCNAEIPHLKKLEEEMHGKDVVFIGISTDKDKEAWLKFLKEKGLSGVQLLAGPGNELAKYYRIGGIPRFMVFDRQGNIVDAYAPRPSDPKLKELIKKML